MLTIKAPEGFEALRCYNDDARQWDVYARRIGQRWWRNLGGVGHAYLTDDELDARAVARVVDDRLGFLVVENAARIAAGLAPIPS